MIVWSVSVWSVLAFSKSKQQALREAGRQTGLSASHPSQPGPGQTWKPS